ncbi:hypothetical protein PCASD_14261, partial [Puccinia coronata f. sp. avenae]
MADVEAILFPSPQKMLDNFPGGDDSLPSSTNAQESMHCVYYMFSSGKKSMMKGMVELYAFVKALERDHINVMRGVPIRYGSQSKKQVDIAQSIGWVKPTKRQRAASKEQAAKNDGRPPDTTKLLLGESTRPRKKAKLGRPANSPNIDKNPYTTPLWLRRPGGKSTDMFYSIVSHFSTQSTHELTKSTSLKMVLTNGSGKIFNIAHQKKPMSFVPGKEASCDEFIGSVMDNKSNSSKVLADLFLTKETCCYTCPQHKGQVTRAREERTHTDLTICASMFDQNSISQTEPAKLMELWLTQGLFNVSGLTCPECKSKKKSAATLKNKEDPGPPLLEDVSTISFPGASPPAHLYFYVLLTAANNQQSFADEMNWPSKMELFGTVYTLISRGFFGRRHYWGKVVRQVNGVTGVWMHNDNANGGHACLISTETNSIGGAEEKT